MELIDRKALIDELPNNSMDTMTAYQIGLMILRQPTIPERTAEKHHTWPEKQQLAQCLGCAALVGDKFNYCPNCGAKFKEADNAPYKPPHEDNGPTARALIEAEIAKYEEMYSKEKDVRLMMAFSFRIGGLQFALECLDKPKEAE